MNKDIDITGTYKIVAAHGMEECCVLFGKKLKKFNNFNQIILQLNFF